MIVWCLAERWQTSFSRIVPVATIVQISVPRNQHHSRSTSATTTTPDVQCPFRLSVITCRLSRLCWLVWMNKFELDARQPHSLQWQQWLQHNDFMPRNQRSFWWKRPRITIFLGYPDFIVIRASHPMKFRYMIPLFPFLYSQSSLLKLCTKATQVGFSVKAHSFQRTCISPSRLCFWLSKAVKDLELTKLRLVEYILPTQLPSQ